MAEAIPYFSYTIETAWDIYKRVNSLKTNAVSKSDILELEEAVAQRPYGQAAVILRQRTLTDYESVGDWFVSWYTLHWTKYICLLSARVKQGAFANAAEISITYQKKEAWKDTFPDRAYKLKNLICRRKMARENVYPPQDIMISKIYDSKYGIFIAEDTGGRLYTCTPAGCAQHEEIMLSVDDVIGILGVKLPHLKKDRVWEKIEPHWVMAVLKK